VTITASTISVLLIILGVVLGNVTWFAFRNPDVGYMEFNPYMPWKAFRLLNKIGKILWAVSYATLLIGIGVALILKLS
jgi:hypothetical protein